MNYLHWIAGGAALLLATKHGRRVPRGCVKTLPLFDSRGRWTKFGLDVDRRAYEVMDELLMEVEAKAREVGYDEVNIRDFQYAAQAGLSDTVLERAMDFATPESCPNVITIT
tara:strand:+ start:185 stop:520 length:336 start_codon:yes stop_codon:yes gene_type:complete